VSLKVLLGVAIAVACSPGRHTVHEVVSDVREAAPEIGVGREVGERLDALGREENPLPDCSDTGWVTTTLRPDCKVQGGDDDYLGLLQVIANCLEEDGGPSWGDAMAVSPDGRHLYLARESMVVMELTSCGLVNSVVHSIVSGSGNMNYHELDVATSGEFVIAAGRPIPWANDVLHLFYRDAATGALFLVGWDSPGFGVEEGAWMAILDRYVATGWNRDFEGGAPTAHVPRTCIYDAGVSPNPLLAIDSVEAAYCEEHETEGNPASCVWPTALAASGSDSRVWIVLGQLLVGYDIQSDGALAPLSCGTVEDPQGKLEPPPGTVFADTAGSHGLACATGIEVSDDGLHLYTWREGGSCESDGVVLAVSQSPMLGVFSLDGSCSVSPLQALELSSLACKEAQGEQCSSRSSSLGSTLLVALDDARMRAYVVVGEPPSVLRIPLDAETGAFELGLLQAAPVPTLGYDRLDLDGVVLAPATGRVYLHGRAQNLSDGGKGKEVVLVF